MSRKVIEIVQVLVDRIEKNGYQQRAREENAFDLNKRLTEAEGWVAHWKQARQEAHEAGELMQAEIETLRKKLADAERAASDEFTERQVLTVEQQQDAAIWQQQLDAANAMVVLQRAGIERLNAFVDKVRELLAIPLAQISYDDMSVVRAELAALDDEPTPVAEPLDAEGGQ